MRAILRSPASTIYLTLTRHTARWHVHYSRECGVMVVQFGPLTIEVCDWRMPR